SVLPPPILFSIILLPHLSCALFPYTTLFRSALGSDGIGILLAFRNGFAAHLTCRVYGVLRLDCRDNLRHGDGQQSPCRRLSRQSDRKSTRLNSSHVSISYAVFCLKKKKKTNT